MNRELVFFIKFVVIFSVLYLLIYFAELSLLTNWLAELQRVLFGFNSSGNLVLSTDTVFEINNFCSGLSSAAVFAAVVFSFRKPEITRKVLLFVFGFLVLMIVNLLRIWFVVFFDANVVSGSAESVHVVSWFLMSAAIIGVWYFAVGRIAAVKNLSDLL